MELSAVDLEKHCLFSLILFSVIDRRSEYPAVLGPKIMRRQNMVMHSFRAHQRCYSCGLVSLGG